MNIDVLFLIEHKDRELQVVQDIANTLEESGKSVAIFSVIFHMHKVLKLKPKVICFPYAVSSIDWPFCLLRSYFKGSKFFHLNWEQHLFKIYRTYKAPRGDELTKDTYFLSWFGGNKDFLMENGVPSENIFVTGNPSYSRLRANLSHAEELKDQLLGQSKNKYREVIFLPMNYSWAFSPDHKVQEKVDKGFPKDFAFTFRDFAKDEIRSFIKFLHRECKDNSELLFILRPHPSIGPQNYEEIFEELNLEIPKNLNMRKDFSIREWLVISDIVLSSWSTTVIDAIKIGKRAALFSDKDKPEYIDMDWYSEVPLLRPNDKIKDLEFNNSYSQTLQVDDEVQNLTNVLVKLVDDSNIEIKRNYNLKPHWIKIILKRFFLPAFIKLGIRKNFLFDKFKAMYYR